MIAKERVSQHAWMPPWVVRDHVARYRFAGAHVQGVVVDCACGDGTGTEEYAKRAEHVHAFDIKAGAIEDVRDRRLGNVTAQVADGRHLPCADASADVVVSFETIEHIADQAGFVAEIARVLRPGGTLILSTPNRPIYSPGTTLDSDPWNPYHVRELDRDDLTVLLASYFDRMTWYGQATSRPFFARVLTAIGRVAPRFAVRLRQAWKLRLFVWDSDARYEVRPLDPARPSESLVVTAHRIGD